MAVQGLHIGQIMRASLDAWDHMIYLDDVPAREEQSAAQTYSPLSLKEDGHPRGRQWVIAEPLHPIPQVAVIGTGHAAHFHVTADGRVGVMHEAQSV